MLARQAGASGASGAFVPPTAMKVTHRPLVKGPSQVQPGDIFLYGPDKWGIHHAVMSIGQMSPAPHAAQLIWNEIPEVRGMDIYCCETVESTRALQGREIFWYVARSFFARDPRNGEAVIVGDMGKDSDVLEFHHEPWKVKMLMHPLRSGHGGPAFDAHAFQHALKVAATTSQRWSLKTAVRGLISRRESQGLDPDDYSTPQARAAMLEDLQMRWEKRPICTSVAIMVWQRYFMLVSSHGPDATDVAAQHILRWMPLLSDKTLPSAMIKELSKCGWVMRGNIDA